MKARSLKCADITIFRFVSIMLIAAFMVNSEIAAEKPVCSVVLETREKDSDFIVTFAHPFRKGDVKETVVPTHISRGPYF